MVSGHRGGEPVPKSPLFLVTISCRARPAEIADARKRNKLRPERDRSAFGG